VLHAAVKAGQCSVEGLGRLKIPAGGLSAGYPRAEIGRAYVQEQMKSKMPIPMPAVSRSWRHALEGNDDYTKQQVQKVLIVGAPSGTAHDHSERLHTAFAAGANPVDHFARRELGLWRLKTQGVVVKGEPAGALRVARAEAGQTSAAPK